MGNTPTHPLSHSLTHLLILLSSSGENIKIDYVFLSGSLHFLYIILNSNDIYINVDALEIINNKVESMIKNSKTMF